MSTTSSVGRLSSHDVFHQFKDERALYVRVFHIAQACLRSIVYGFRMALNTIVFYFSKNRDIYPISIVREEKIQFKLEEMPWNVQTSSSQGLYLFVHGLRGTPFQWNNYLAKLENEKGVHCLAPWVPLRGNCSVEKAADPLLAIVQNYVGKFPKSPVYLIGTSKGSHIISYIETKLQPQPMGPLSVVSIAGVHGGTQWINWFNWFNKIGLPFRWIFDPDLMEQISWDSEHSRELIDAWKEKQRSWQAQGIAARHLFVISTEDGEIWPICSALPKVGGDETHRVCHGQSHLTVVGGVCDEVFQWLKGPSI